MKLKIMLIDDCDTELLFSQKFIKNTIKETDIISFTKAKKALACLKGLAEGGPKITSRFPDIILVDSRMPEMNGFEFMDEFYNLYYPMLSKTRVYMLSCTLSVDEILEAELHDCCSGIYRKPLNQLILQQILYNSSSKLN